MNGKIVPPIRDIINSLDFYLFYNYKLVHYIHWTKEWRIKSLAGPTWGLKISCGLSVRSLCRAIFALLRYRLGQAAGQVLWRRASPADAQNQRAAKARLPSETVARCTTLHCAPQPFSSNANPSPQPVFLHSLTRDGPFLLLNCRIGLTLQNQPCTFLAEETVSSVQPGRALPTVGIQYRLYVWLFAVSLQLKSSTELDSRLTPSTSNGSSVNMHFEKRIPGMGYF